MQNVVLYIFYFFLFQLLHLLCNIRSINNERKQAFQAIFIPLIFTHYFLIGGLYSYAHIVSMTMTLGVLAVNIPILAPT